MTPETLEAFCLLLKSFKILCFSESRKVGAQCEANAYTAAEDDCDGSTMQRISVTFPVASEYETIETVWFLPACCFSFSSTSNVALRPLMDCSNSFVLIPSLLTDTFPLVRTSVSGSDLIKSSTSSIFSGGAGLLQHID